MGNDGEESSENVLSRFQELLQKCEASLMPAIEEHVTNEAFDAAKDGQDFLEVKNSLLLSYLIDLTYNFRQGLLSKEHDEENFRRLLETRTVLDKTRPLEKKMRYQLDKLLAAATSTSFAVGDDPLTYKPDPSALEGANEDGDESDSGSDDDSSQEDGDSDMDDLEAAKATLQKARQKEAARQDEDEDDGIYRAPRLSSMPYPAEDDSGAERQKRRNQRLRQSELAQTLRAEYGEAPEQVDVHGGSEYGKQREAARRMAEREAARISVEEENMVRLTTSRKEKKERKRLMREESSNLAAISDLGSLVRGVSWAFQQDSEEDDGVDFVSGRGVHRQGRETTSYSRKKRAREPKNSLQQALYGKPTKTKKKKRL